MKQSKLDILYNKILDNRFEDRKLQEELCDQYYHYGQILDDDLIMGRALYFKAENTFGSDNTMSESLAKQAHTLLVKADNHELIGRCCNLMGILSSNKEDFSIALEFYLEGHESTKDEDNIYIHAILSCNIGVLFQILENYDKAIYYYTDAIYCFLKTADNAQAIANVTSLHVNLFLCNYKLENKKEMLRCLKYIREHSDVLEPGFSLDMLEAIFHSTGKATEFMSKKIECAVKLSLEQENVSDYIDTYQHLCDFLFSIQRYDDLMKVLDYVESSSERDSYPRIRIGMLKFRLYCLEQAKNYEDYIYWSKEYIKTNEVLTHNYQRSVIESTDLRIQIEALQRNESAYMKKAMTDALTQIYNREAFNQISQETWERAINEKKSISIFLIDIDYFKQVNDHYGHSYGDDVLVRLGRILQSLQNNRTFAFRYGGDEFVLLCFDISMDDTKTIAELIHNDMATFPMEAVDSPIADYVTLSIGVHHGYPAEGESFEAYMKIADDTLYQVKENGRNGYKIL